MPILYQKEIDTNAQSQTNQLFQYFLMQELKTDISLTSPISLDDLTFYVSAGHGFTAGDTEFVTIREGDIFAQARIVAVNVNVITVDIPFGNTFTTDASVIRGDIEMAVDGSSAEKTFKYSAGCCGVTPAVVPIDISFVTIQMSHGVAGDDGKFGGITELTNGMYFRQINGNRINLSNYINNKSFADKGADLEYNDKGPGGTNSTVVQFDMQKKFQAVLRVDPRESQELVAVVRDDLTGLNSMTLSVIGSFTSGE